MHVGALHGWLAASGCLGHRFKIMQQVLVPPLPRPDAAVQLERLTLRLLGSVADGNRCSQAFGQQKEGGSLKEETLLLKMMDIICKNLRAAKFISQRELFYMCARYATGGQQETNRLILKLCQLLSAGGTTVLRLHLGLIASSRGTVSGALSIQEGGSKEWTDCSRLGFAGHLISTQMLLKSVLLRSNALYM